MVNTPPPPNPAPGGDATTSVQADALKGSEDVSSILANLSAEQLASIMDAAVSVFSVDALSNRSRHRRPCLGACGFAPAWAETGPA